MAMARSSTRPPARGHVTRPCDIAWPGLAWPGPPQGKQVTLFLWRNAHAEHYKELQGAVLLLSAPQVGPRPTPRARLVADEDDAAPSAA